MKIPTIILFGIQFLLHFSESVSTNDAKYVNFKWWNCSFEESNCIISFRHWLSIFFLFFFQNSFFHGFKVKEYITLFVDRGSTKKLFSTDFVNIFLFRPKSARSYKISAVGNIRWVGNAVFSEMTLRIFLISSLS